MAYSSGFFQLKYIEMNKEINRYIEMKKLNETELVILAAHLAFQLTLWLDNIVEKANQNEIFELYIEEEQLNERIPTDIKFNESQRNQKAFNQIILKNSNESNDLKNAIRYGIECTVNVLDNFESVNSK